MLILFLLILFISGLFLFSFLELVESPDLNCHFFQMLCGFLIHDNPLATSILAPHFRFHNNDSALNTHVTLGRWQKVPSCCNSHSVRRWGVRRAIVLPPLVFLFIRVQQWPLLRLLFSAYEPFIPTGVVLKSFIVCFQTWHSKIKVSSYSGFVSVLIVS